MSADVDPGPGNMLCKKGEGDAAADMNEAAYNDFDISLLRSPPPPPISLSSLAFRQCR